MRGLPAADLWRDRDFVRFWAGESVSLVGSQITALALPFMAVLVLGASPAQMGLLGALGFLPFLVVTLPAGAWIDRHRRRPTLIVANLARAALIATIPLAALFGVLRMELLYVIAFAVGVLTVAFDVAYLAYVPSLVSRERLTTANGRLLASASAAEMGGPGLAGLLISLVGAPLALAVDAASYVVSAVSLIGISREEPAPPPEAPGRRDLVAEIREGLRVTFGSPLLRAVAAEAATYNGLYQMIEVLILLYFTRQLGLNPATIGLLFAHWRGRCSLGSVVAGRLRETIRGRPRAGGLDGPRLRRADPASPRRRSTARQHRDRRRLVLPRRLRSRRLQRPRREHPPSDDAGSIAWSDERELPDRGLWRDPARRDRRRGARRAHRPARDVGHCRGWPAVRPALDPAIADPRDGATAGAASGGAGRRTVMTAPEPRRRLTLRS